MTKKNGHDQQDIGGLEDRIVEDVYGTRQYTLDGLCEKIIEQFGMETNGRLDILADLNTLQKQKQAIREVAEYVLGVESVMLQGQERTWLLDRLHRDLYRFGALETVLNDEAVTEININSPKEIFLRRGFGDLERVNVSFRDGTQLAQMLQRVLTPLGFDLWKGEPFIETGLKLMGRPVRFSLAGPPMTPYYTGQIRLHPSQPMTWDDLQGSIPKIAADMLMGIVRNGHGLLMVGDGGMGKTTLLANLLAASRAEKSGLVQRAPEIQPNYLPPHATDYTLISADAPSTANFEKQIRAALGMRGLFLDEIQGDEGTAFWQVLSSDTKPQVVATFRGKANIARLYSAIGMVVRKVYRSVPQSQIDAALMERLPFVAILEQQEAGQAPRMSLIGQWARVEEGEAGLTIEPLLTWARGDDRPKRTDIQMRLESD
ncbi:MAG: Flp pilus assembly complex ATPase component TadA [Chloroflexi bacterium]|nr:Flp pilus assembly complex ATPase component TadA [Chloroflexota bacterium]